MKLNYTGSAFFKNGNKYNPLPIWDKEVSVDDVVYPYEYWGNIINNMQLPSYYVKSDQYNIDNVREDLQFLNSRLDYLRKTITYWDSYQIQDVIEKPEDISKINSIVVGTSLINNLSDPFKWKNNVCTRGGVFVNTYNAGIIYVPSQAAGTYTPIINYSSADEGSISISYDFNDGVPSETIDTTPSGINFLEEEYYKVFDDNEDATYDVWKGLEDFNNNMKQSECKAFPVINFFIENKINKECEEIVFDMKIGQISGTYQILDGFNISAIIDNLPENKQIIYKVK